MLKRIQLIPLFCLGLGLSCAENTKFKGTPDAGSAPKAADVEPAPDPTVEVSVPVNEIRSGKKTLQAKALVKNSEKKTVTWTLEGPEGVDLGSIDKKGLYTSPESLKEDMDVVIKATLASNTKIFDSKTIKVIPAEKIFVGCTAGSQVFPIKADVYRLPKDTQKLPDFDTVASDKISTVCMDQYNVPERSFNDGFPGVEGLNEWFALHTSGKLKITVPGDYNFRLNSDDGSMLYIDGKTVVDNNGLHSPSAREGSITLTAGTHDFILDYYQGPADRIALELFWQVPGSTEFITVPSNAFEQ